MTQGNEMTGRRISGAHVRKRRNATLVFPRRDVALLIPGLLGFVLFYVFPSFRSFRYAFVSQTFQQTWTGLTQFERVLNNSSFQKAMINSLTLTFCFVIAGMAGAVIVALLLHETRRFRWVHGITLLCVFLPSSGIGTVWRVWPSALSDNMRALLFSEWKYLGIPVTIFVIGLSCVEREQIEASSLDGANRAQQYFHVIFPNMKWFLSLGCFFLIIQSQRLFREVYILFGSYPPDHVYLLQHYMIRHYNHLDYPALAASSVLMTIVYGIMAFPFLVHRRRR